MSENIVESGGPDPLRTVADAMETAVQAAREGAADAKEAVEEAIPAVARFLSRFVYTTCYSLSYGVVFPTVMLVRALPKDNAVVQGLTDGARAARDRVGDWTAQRSVPVPAGAVAPP